MNNAPLNDENNTYSSPHYFWIPSLRFSRTFSCILNL